MDHGEAQRLTDRDLLMQIITELRSYNTHLQDMTLKIVTALIGLSAASVGLKFINSPWPFILATYATWFAGVFLLGVTAVTWRHLYWLPRLLRLALAALMIFSATVRTFVYEAGISIAPRWYPPIMDVLYVTVAILAIVSVWNHWDKPQVRRKD